MAKKINVSCNRSFCSSELRRSLSVGIKLNCGAPTFARRILFFHPAYSSSWIADVRDEIWFGEKQHPWGKKVVATWSTCENGCVDGPSDYVEFRRIVVYMMSLKGSATFASEYLAQLGLALVAMVVGFVCDMLLDSIYYGTAFEQLGLFSIFVTGVLGYCISWFRPSRAAGFVWVPGLLSFLCVGLYLTSAWNAAWVNRPRLAYAWDSLFGPNCNSQECIYTIPTDIFLSSVAYSIAAKLAQMRVPK